MYPLASPSPSAVPPPSDGRNLGISDAGTYAAVHAGLQGGCGAETTESSVQLALHTPFDPRHAAKDGALITIPWRWCKSCENTMTHAFAPHPPDPSTLIQPRLFLSYLTPPSSDCANPLPDRTLFFISPLKEFPTPNSINPNYLESTTTEKPQATTSLSTNFLRTEKKKKKTIFTTMFGTASLRQAAAHAERTPMIRFLGRRTPPGTPIPSPNNIPFANAANLTKPQKQPTSTTLPSLTLPLPRGPFPRASATATPPRAPSTPRSPPTATTPSSSAPSRRASARSESAAWPATSWAP